MTRESGRVGEERGVAQGLTREWECHGFMGGFNGGNCRVDGERRETTWRVPHVREKQKGERCCALLGLLGGLAGPRARASFGPVSILFFPLLSFIIFCFYFFSKLLQKSSKLI
jgi:hypothetical protein